MNKKNVTYFMYYDYLFCIFQSNEYNGFLYDTSQGITLHKSSLLEKPKNSKPFTRLPYIGTFKVKCYLNTIPWLTSKLYILIFMLISSLLGKFFEGGLF